MRRRLSRLTAAMAAAWVMFAKSPALGDVRTDARREFRAGMALVASGNYDEGIAHLEQAYEILPHPNVLYNIALAHMYAGRPEAALYYFERYKETAPASDAEEVDTMMRSLREAKGAVAKGEENPASSTSTQAQGTTPDAPRLEGAESVAAVERAAEELRKLAEASNSDALRRHAEELERAAQGLRAAASARPQAGTEQAPPASETKPPPPPVASVQPRSKVQEGVYEEEVVSASRMAQSPLDAPNATSIITAQDIRMTGITNLGELLRRVAGVEVNSVTPNHTEVSIRGLNRRLSNKVLLLLDGRPLRLDFLGTNWFDMLPIAIEDVERVEVIRGPASALYGADAFSGIINVITRAPGTGDSYIFAGGGNKGQGRAVASVTGKRGDVAYRLGFGYRQAYNAVDIVGKNRVDVEPFTESPDIASRGVWANAEAQYAISKRTLWTLGGHATYGDYNLQAISRMGQQTATDSLRTYVYSSLTTPLGIRVASFWDHSDGNSASSYLTPGAIDPIGVNIVQHIGDVDVSWSDTVHLLFPHTLTVGGGYRFKSIDWNWLDGTHVQHHVGAYVQDVMQVAKPLRIQVGARMDRHPLLSSLQWSPRGSIVYRFVEDQSLRVSVGRAFRGPSFLESYLELPNAAPVRGASAWGLGNDKLDPESITSYEIGYQNQASDYFALEVNGYFNMVKDAILFTDVTRYRLTDFADPNNRLAAFDPNVDAFPISSLAFTNERATFRQLGGEAGIRLYPYKGLDVYSNYSIHDTRPLAEADRRQIDPVRAKEQQTSLHKVNGGVQYRSPFGLDLSLDVSWYSRQVWVEQVTDEVNGVRFETFPNEGFVVLHGRIGYRLPGDRVELGLVGTNLTFGERRQHPLGQPMDTRVLATTKVRF